MSPKHPELVSKCSSWWYFEIPLWTELGVGSILVITCGFTALCRQQRNFIHRKKSVSTGKMVMSKGVSHEPLPTIDIDPRWSPSQIHQSYCLGSFCYGEGFSFLFGYNQEKHDRSKLISPVILVTETSCAAWSNHWEEQNITSVMLLPKMCNNLIASIKKILN